MAMKQRMKGGPRQTITSLNVMVKATERGLWPTPRAEGFDAGAHRGTPDSLHSAVKLLPTPTATFEHVSDMETQMLSGQQRAKLREQGTPFESRTGGKLSAAWVQRMMNYPDGWLDVE